MSEAPLSGKTVALIGLSREIMLDTTAAVEAGGGRWQAFSTAERVILPRSYDA